MFSNIDNFLSLLCNRPRNPNLLVQQPYFIAAIFAAVSCLLTFILFSETSTHKKENQTQWSYFSYSTIKKVIVNPDVLKISAILFLSQIGWSLYYQFIPPILKTVLNFNAHTLGIFVGMIAFWLTLATTFGIRFFDKFFSLREMLFLAFYLLFFGLVISAVGSLTYFSHTPFWVWFGAIPTAIGDVVAYSCLITFYSNVVNKDEQGKVMGLCFVIIGLIWASSAMIGGFLMRFHSQVPLFIAPFGVFLAIGLLHSSFSKSLR